MKRSTLAVMAFCTMGTVAAMAFTTPLVSANDDGSPPPPPPAKGKHEGKPEAPRDPMIAALEKLDLSPAQKDKIKTILADAKAKMKQVYLEKRDGPKEDLRNAMHELHDATRHQIEAELTEEQLKKFKALMEESHEGKGPHDPPTTAPSKDPNKDQKGDGWEPAK